MLNRSVRTKIIGGVLALGLVGMTAGTASAEDIGDRKEGCNRYEICFSEHWKNYRYQKHFHYEGEHTGYRWYDTKRNRATSRDIRNSASAVANRDGRCDVRVVNDRGILPDTTRTFGNVPNRVDWRYLDKLNDANDRHERINCA